MEKKPDKSHVNESHNVTSALVIDEVLQSIDKVDKEIEKFYEIHGSELQVMKNQESKFRTD